MTPVSACLCVIILTVLTKLDLSVGVNILVLVIAPPVVNVPEPNVTTCVDAVSVSTPIVVIVRGPVTVFV